jgi:sulfatase maturation enzyme AslB (radical SAM superfamily)
MAGVIAGTAVLGFIDGFGDETQGGENMPGAIAGTSALKFNKNGGDKMAGAIAGTSLVKFKSNGDDKMGGAIAGKATLDLEKTGKLELVTMTVNDECNMSCPQCYLQYDGSKEYISKETQELVLSADFKHLALVGKEPLFNMAHTRLTELLAYRTIKSGKTVSMITNGTNLHLIKHPELFSFIDVSFDGGRNTYSRLGDYNAIISSINSLALNGGKFNALHTLNKNNIDNISDMVSVNNDANFGIVMFSPYLITRKINKNNGTKFVTAISIEEVLQKMSENNYFMDAKNTLLNIDIYHAEQENIKMSEVKEAVQKYGLNSKVALFDNELTKYVIRVTYDGLVMSPRDSLNTADYDVVQMKLNGDLNLAHQEILKRV